MGTPDSNHRRRNDEETRIRIVNVVCGYHSTIKAQFLRPHDQEEVLSFSPCKVEGTLSKRT